MYTRVSELPATLPVMADLKKNFNNFPKFYIQKITPINLPEKGSFCVLKKSEKYLEILFRLLVLFNVT